MRHRAELPTVAVAEEGDIVVIVPWPVTLLSKKLTGPLPWLPWSVTVLDFLIAAESLGVPGWRWPRSSLCNCKVWGYVGFPCHNPESQLWRRAWLSPPHWHNETFGLLWCLVPLAKGPEASLCLLLSLISLSFFPTKTSFISKDYADLKWIPSTFIKSHLSYLSCVETEFITSKTILGPIASELLQQKFQ